MNTPILVPRLLSLTLLCASAAEAATLTVTVGDAAGKPLLDAVVLLESTQGKLAVKPMADAEISQSKRTFQPRVTLITTGTRVTFPNFDTVRHHVYSFAPIKTFELKLYAGVPNQPITFDKPDIAALGCNIHDTMAAWVVVADTPYAARSDTDGVARIEGLPAGSYRMRVWHPALPPTPEPAASTLTLGSADLAQAVRLAVGTEP